MSSQPDQHKQSEQHQGIVDIVGLLLVVSLIGIHWYHSVTTGSLTDPVTIQNFGIGLIFAIGLVLYFSPYWRPVLFLIWMVIAGAFTIFFALQRTIFPHLETLRIGLGTSLFLVFFYLFYRDQTDSET